MARHRKSAQVPRSWIQATDDKGLVVGQIACWLLDGDVIRRNPSSRGFAHNPFRKVCLGRLATLDGCSIGSVNGAEA